MPSDQYYVALAEAKAHHASSKTYSGKFLRPHKSFLSMLIAAEGMKSALDYGAGKGAQYRWIDPDDGLTLEQAWGIEVTKFDPAWPPFAAEPQGEFDLVLCTHTLGSIPLADQAWVLERIMRLAKKAVYIAEKIGPVHKAVHGARVGFANGWTRDQWVNLLRQACHATPSPAVVWLSTVESVEAGRIMTREVILC